MLPGLNVADVVLEYARQHNITKIIAGKPARARWLEMVRGSVLERLIERSGDIDVYVISGGGEAAPVAAPSSWRPHRPWQRYLWSLVLVGAITLFSVPIHRFVAPTNVVMLYLAAVVIAALYLGRGPAILTAGAGCPGVRFLLGRSSTHLYCR